MVETFPFQDQITYIIISIYFILLAKLLIHTRPDFWADVLNNGQHNKGIDGLRGFLALGVFFHHAVMFYWQQKDGSWVAPPSRFYTLTGQAGVSIFFMITGFLFWQKAIRSNGKFNIRQFYLARYKRLAPAYFFSVLVVFVIMALPGDAISWESLRWKDMYHAFFFRGIRSAGIINGPYWTLTWEWKFYILLPLLALCVRKYRVLIPAAALLAYTIYKPEIVFIFNFLCGICAAMIVERGMPKTKLENPVFSAIALKALIILFLFFDHGYGYLQSILMFVFFICIVQGNSLFGLLICRPAILLGSISYSIYLLHIPLIYLVINCINAYVQISALTELQYAFLIMPVAGTVVILGALLSYHFFERPFMKKIKPV